jgi:hypothetical protein
MSAVEATTFNFFAAASPGTTSAHINMQNRIEVIKPAQPIIFFMLFS